MPRLEQQKKRKVRTIMEPAIHSMRTKAELVCC